MLLIGSLEQRYEGRRTSQLLCNVILPRPRVEWRVAEPYDTQTLVPAQQLAATNKAHYPNESAEYRAARNKLLVEEIELRRHLERVASQRRALPAGGEIPQDFQLSSETSPVYCQVFSAINARS